MSHATVVLQWVISLYSGRIPFPTAEISREADALFPDLLFKLFPLKLFIIAINRYLSHPWCSFTLLDSNLCSLTHSGNWKKRGLKKFGLFFPLSRMLYLNLPFSDHSYCRLPVCWATREGKTLPQLKLTPKNLKSICEIRTVGAFMNP